MRKRVISILLVINLVYLIAGAFIFSAIESTDDDNRPATENIIRRFVGNRSCVPSDEMEDFAKTLIRSLDKGFVGENWTLVSPDWSFPSALLFTVTAITTIGYGHVTPTTGAGQVTCVLYVLLGIPLMATLLAGIGSNMSKAIHRIFRQKVWVEYSNRVDTALKMAIVNIALTAAVVLIPAAVFSHIEGWSYGVSVYYATITLTTVGFGDYYVDPRHSEGGDVLYNLGVGVWILLGLAVVATMVSGGISLLSGKINSHVKKSRRTSDTQTSQTDLSPHWSST